MKPTQLILPRALRRALTIGAALLLAGCASSAPFNFYSLVGPAPDGADATGTPLLIEVMPTRVPQQVQRPQLVLTTGDGQVKILEQQRWSQPLNDEISQALSQDLTHELPAMDVYRSAHRDNQAVYRVAVDVQHFESVAGSHVTLATVWSVTHESSLQTCRSRLTEAVTTGATAADYQALIDAHRRALQRLSAQIAAAIKRLGAMPASHTGAVAATPPCPAES